MNELDLTDDLIERCAKAAHEAFSDATTPGRRPLAWHTLTDRHRDGYRAIARAVLEGLRS